MNDVIRKLLPRPLREYIATMERRVARLEAQIAFDPALESGVGIRPYEAGQLSAFNGQTGRKQIFDEVVSRIPFAYIVETGAWRGDTTGYMAQVSRLPVFTCELNHQMFRIASSRLSEVNGVSITLADSRRFLQDLARDKSFTAQRAFFYLDAHWHADLPLHDELTIVAREWRDFVVMIDDFKVVGDGGYGFDTYGPGKELTIESINTILAGRHLTAYFPTMSASGETGHKRGCIVLASKSCSDRLSGITSLRRHKL